MGCKEHHQTAAALADHYITPIKDRRSYLPMIAEKYRCLKLVCIGSEVTMIAGTEFKSNDQEIIGNIVSQLEPQEFEADAVVEQKKGKMEESKARYDTALPVLNVQGLAQFNAMHIK